MVQAAVRIEVEEPRRAARHESREKETTGPGVLVGRTNSAFPIPLDGCIARGAGSRVWDDDGREYIDLLLSSGPMILGHSHPRVRQAVADQMLDGFAFNVLNRHAVALAERIVAIPGCGELVRFASTGTEATMHAVRLARAFTGRDKVLVFTGGYHGSHDLSIVGHRGAVKASKGGVPTAVIEDTLLATFDDIGSVESVFARHGSEIAAVLMEPQQRSVDPSPGFLDKVAEICRENGAILIFDEVLTGFRLAYGGAQEFYGVSADLVCYGKIVGGGFPLSAVAGRHEIMRLADPALAGTSQFVHLSGTMSGNPVSAAAGLATLEELEQPGVYERLHAAGERLRDGLREQMKARGVAGSIVGNGPIAALSFGENGRSDSAVALRNEVNRRLVEGGVLAQLQTRFYVSLAHSDEDIDLATGVFGEALSAATRSLELPVEFAAG
jgi:glutamate-1-semialdehyde 2,1-aminomutase